MIIIKTPQPDTEERLVLVPPESCTPVFDDGKQTGLSVRAQGARDATPADLERGGYVAAHRDELSSMTTRVATLAAALETERDLTEKQRARAEKAEGLLIQRETELRLAREDGDERARDLRQAYERAVAAAEKAELERDEALGRAQSETEWRVRAVSERQDAEVERDTLRAELARLTAPGEGSEGDPWRAYGEPTDQELVDAFEHAYRNAPSVRTHATAIRTIYRLGVAHERARHTAPVTSTPVSSTPVTSGRATDEELFAVYEREVSRLRKEAGEKPKPEKKPDPSIYGKGSYFSESGAIIVTDPDGPCFHPVKHPDVRKVGSTAYGDWIRGRRGRQGRGC